MVDVLRSNTTTWPSDTRRSLGENDQTKRLPKKLDPSVTLSPHEDRLVDGRAFSLSLSLCEFELGLLWKYYLTFVCAEALRGGAESGMTRMPLSLAPMADMEALVSSWWDEINESNRWQDGIFYTLCALYALVSSVALVPHSPSLSLSR